MNLIVHSPSARVAMQIGIAATISGANVELQPTAADLTSRLYRDGDAIGLYFREGWTDSVETARGMREAGVLNLLFCVVDQHERDESAKAMARARILNAGADDVQTWPVDPKEIASRLHALKRRTRVPADHMFIPPAAMFDPVNQKVMGNGHVVHLTAKESALLEILASRSGACLSKAVCMSAIYGGRDEPELKIIDVFLCKLRKKLKPVCGEHDLIETVWGQGLRFREWSDVA
ncbi:MAG: response regulator transcription factor [Mesorhizobium sp.]|nr:response regulator transcription factor [Mesorhizobium sp.]MCO5085125.1 response regulator transcription factor [Rhizobiaceae bacterium]MCO5164621.1 response regulator transcription factor [Mesorhizobium sp.]